MGYLIALVHYEGDWSDDRGGVCFQSSPTGRKQDQVDRFEGERKEPPERCSPEAERRREEKKGQIHRSRSKEG